MGAGQKSRKSQHLDWCGRILCWHRFSEDMGGPHDPCVKKERGGIHPLGLWQSVPLTFLLEQEHFLQYCITALGVLLWLQVNTECRLSRLALLNTLHRKESVLMPIDVSALKDWFPIDATRNGTRSGRKCVRPLSCLRNTVLNGINRYFARPFLLQF